MQDFMLNLFYAIVILCEIGLFVVVLDAVLRAVGALFHMSWEKTLTGVLTGFGLLWLKDFLDNKKKEKKFNNESEGVKSACQDIG